MRARRASAFEDLDDDHAPAATRTWMRERLRLGAICNTGLALWSGHIEQLSRPRDVLGTLAAGEQTIVADAVEAVRQHVDEEAADELVVRERHHLGPLTSLGAIILPLEGDGVAVERDQAAVGDGDAVGVARQIGEHRLRPAEWTLSVDHPFDFAQRRQISGERLRVVEISVVAEELQTAGGVSRDELLQE